MKEKVYVFVFDGFADWEPAHALCGVAMSGKQHVVTVGLTLQPIRSMGGLKVVPDTTVEQVSHEEAALFMLPGGHLWEQGSSPPVIRLLQQCQARNVPVAAICAATLEVARAGLTKGVRHTSNALDYLKGTLPGYADEDYYVDAPAVRDGGLITASGVASTEFAREVFRTLGSFSDDKIDAWFDLYKHGVWSPALQTT